MNARHLLGNKATLLAGAAAVAMFVLAPYASATSLGIDFGGTLGSGHATLTLATDTVAGDPAGAQSITDASGTFSSATLNINNASIVGVRALNFATPPPNETLPGSYSALIPGAAPTGSYDNLFYANGSPLVCIVNGAPTYPFAGGFLDIFGVMFELDNGDFVDLWSAGVMPVVGLNYGLKVFDGQNDFAVLGAQENGVVASVPEPGFLWLFGAVLVGLFAWRRMKERNRLPAAL